MMWRYIVLCRVSTKSSLFLQILSELFDGLHLRIVRSFVRAGHQFSLGYQHKMRSVSSKNYLNLHE